MRFTFRAIVLLAALLASGCATLSSDEQLTISGFVHGKVRYIQEEDRHEVVDVDGIYIFEENSTCTYPDIGEVPCMMTGFSFSYELRQPSVELVCSIYADSNLTYGTDFERVDEGKSILQYRIQLKSSEHTHMRFQGLRDDGSGIDEVTYTTVCEAEGEEVITFTQHFIR